MFTPQIYFILNLFSVILTLIILILKKRDYYKKNLCKDRRITLIVVPYTVKLEKLKEYIIAEYNKITGDTLRSDSTNN
jgi:hypothetical protein